MSITLVTGVPGSGKSFYCMDMLEKMLRSEDEFLVLTNIEGLNVTDNRVIFCDWKRETKWFQNSNQEKGVKKLRDEHNLPDSAKIIYIIDEAQRFFPPELKDNDTVFFFDYHRHYGMDIYLVTQHQWKLSKKIATLVELEYRAVNNKINPLPVFVYKVLAGGEQFKTEKLKKRKEVFALYCSFQAGDKGKSDKTMLVWVVLAFVVFGGSWMAWRASFADSLGARTKEMQGLNDKAENIRQQDLLSSRRSKVTSLGTTVPATYDTEPIQQKESPFRPGQNGGVDDESPRYQAPVVKKYVKNTDSLVYAGDNGFDITCQVSDFIERFPTMLYGYGYLHVSGSRFIMMDAGTHDIIFPVHYSIPEPAGRTPAARSVDVVSSRSGSGYVESRTGHFDYDNEGYTLQDRQNMLQAEFDFSESRRVLGTGS